MIRYSGSNEKDIPIRTICLWSIFIVLVPKIDAVGGFLLFAVHEGLFGESWHDYSHNKIIAKLYLDLQRM